MEDEASAVGGEEMLTTALTVLLAAVIGPTISAFVGRYVARLVTENALKRLEERATKAENLYQIAVTYLHQVADWANRNGIADKLPDPPLELGISI